MSTNRATKHTARRELGRMGEDYAVEYFRDRGAEVIDRNASFPAGELDLVVREADGEIVFVEVKTRASLDFGGAESVTPAKQRRLRAAAATWLSNHRELGWLRVRFDVLLLVSTGPGASSEFEVDHYEGIFDGAR